MTGIIESRMIDSDFSVDVLAQEIGISRTGLFTKLKAVSGMTPNDFIRIIRLRKQQCCFLKMGCRLVKPVFRLVFHLHLILQNVFRRSSGLLLRNSSV